MGAAPGTEAIIARFAERVGAAPGLAFRITRKSVMTAAEAGATTEAVLDALTRASARPIPQNVRREISGWMALVRRATLRATHLIECPDEDTAARVTAALGPKARRITPTLIEVTVNTAAQRSALTKQLRAGGVFLSDVEGRADAEAPRPRRVRGVPIDIDWSDE